MQPEYRKTGQDSGPGANVPVPVCDDNARSKPVNVHFYGTLPCESPIEEGAWLPFAASPVGQVAHGNLLYYNFSRDGFSCIWAARGRGHDAAARRDIRCLSLPQRANQIIEGADLFNAGRRWLKMLLNMTEYTSNTWMTEWKQR